MSKNNNLIKIYDVMDSFSRHIKKILEGICALLLFLCFLTLLFQVLYRLVIIKFVSFSFPFTEEFARYVLIWIVYLVSGINIYEGSHVAIDFIYDRVKQKTRYKLFYIARCLSIIVVCVILFFSIIVVANNLNYRSSTLRLPGWALFSAPTVGMILIFYELVTEFIGVLCGKIFPFAKRVESAEQAK